MKKILNSIIVLMVFCSSFLTLNISAEKATVLQNNLFNYAQNAELEIYEVTGFWRNKTDIVEFPEINGSSTIEGVSAGAFKDETGITEVLTTTTMKYIGAEAFAGCTSLTRVEFFQNIKEIGVDAFKDCPVTFYALEDSPAIEYAIANDIPYEIIEHKIYTLTLNPNAGPYADIEFTNPPEFPYSTTKKKTTEKADVTISYGLGNKVGYSFYGWEDEEGNEYKNNTTIKMYRQDVTLTPVYKKIYRITYHAQDYANDPKIAANIVSSLTRFYDKNEDMPFELQASNSFSCKGYKLMGWYCEQDQKEYAPDSSYIMPSSDVNMYAIWKPQEYSFTFKADNGTNESFKLSGTYGIEMEIPVCEFEKNGYIFKGWKYGSTDTLYQPGDIYEVLPLVSGQSPSAFIAQWEMPLPDADYGDIDLDGHIGRVGDIILLSKHVSRKLILPADSDNYKNSNCNAKGEEAAAINAQDLKALIDYLLGSVNSLPIR
jgi:hypothetical protein